MDPFNRLPAELIDFSAVENILSASYYVNAVFHADPTIIRNLILSDSITSLPEIQKMCYNINLIQTHSIQFPSLADYQQTFEKMPPVEYTPELSIALLHLAARTQRLACTCLRLIQQNLISALSGVPAGDLQPSRRQQITREPFSFTEERRVHTSLWHLQHYSCLREAATQRWNWDEASLSGLDAYSKWNDTDYYQSEQIWTTAALLTDLDLNPPLRPVYGHYPFQSQERFLAQDPEGEESSRAAWTFPDETPLPLFEFTFFDLPTDTGTTNSSETGSESKTWTPAPPPPETEATKAWRLDAAWRSRLPRQVAIFQRVSGSASNNRPVASNSFLAFKQWRRLGVPIWDEWRMYRIGLYEGPPRRPDELIPNPDGTFLPVLPRDPDERARIPIVDHLSRWLALIGEELPYKRTRGMIGGGGLRLYHD
ncbi:hypothetical protein BJY04DRAFT_231978 [Aspergillus karnatakaensis]|uniref:uncharacterized protein n=1 Tax=Aspergillus karnatakaensis TaxID=1810916 RepID=UPI003CCD2DAA